MRYCIRPVRMATIKKSTNNKYWRGCGEKGTLLHCWWEWKLVQPLGRTVCGDSLKKLEPELPSVQFSHSVVSDSLQPHGLQHSRPPCPSPTPGIYPNSCPLSRWCHPTISCSVVHFSSYLQSFPASGSFPMSQLFTSGGQSLGVSASTSILPMTNWTGWLSLQSKGLASLFQHHSSKASILRHSAFFIVQLTSIHDHWKNHSLDYTV